MHPTFYLDEIVDVVVGSVEVEVVMLVDDDDNNVDVDDKVDVDDEDGSVFELKRV